MLQQPSSKKRNLEDAHEKQQHKDDDQDSTTPSSNISEKDQKHRLVWQDREYLERFRIDNLIQLKQDRKRNEEKRKQIELLEKIDHDDDDNRKESSSKKLFREIETSQHKENIVKLNLRGKMFITTIQTLTKRENMLKVMLESQFGIDRDENGCILIDRDPEYFPIILEHLRTGSTTHIGIWEDVNESSIELLTNLLDESDFYGTDKLTTKVKDLITKYTEELEKINRIKNTKPLTIVQPEIEPVIEVNVDDELWYTKFAMLTLEEKSRVENYFDEQTKKVQEDFEELNHKEKSLPSTKDITIDVRGVKFTISTAKLVRHVDSLFYEVSKKAIQTSGEFNIFLDRDPAIFTIIYEYLVNGTLKNIPNEIEKKKQVFKEAKFFKLKGLLEYFDICRYPIEDMGERNLQIKKEEDFLRNLFAVDRENPILNDPYIHLLNVFGDNGHSTKSFTDERQDPPEKVKLLFDFEDPLEVSSLCQNSKLTVPSLPKLISSRDQFLKQFTIFTGGIFKGMDWSNIFVAGGSVLACALQVPPPNEEQTKVGSESDLYFRHKMTEKFWENDDASTDDDVSTVKTIESNSDEEYFSDDYTNECTIDYPSVQTDEKSEYLHTQEYYQQHPWKKSDIDLFLYGLSETEALKKIEYLYNTFKKNLTNSKKPDDNDNYSDILILRTQHAITFRFNDIKPVQIILRIYKSPAEILCGFDIPCCCIGFDGTQVLCIPRAREAINTRTNIVDPDRQSTTYETRLIKYALRGFRIGICGFDPKKIVNPFLHGLQPYNQSQNIKQFTGLARILMFLESFKRNEKKRALNAIGGKLSLAETEEDLIKPSSKHDYAQITFSINYQAATGDYDRLNDRVDFITKNLKKKPFFEYSLNDIDKIIRPSEMKSDLSPVLEFIQIEPTRQYVGCFSPVDKNFLEDAYSNVRNEKKCKYKYVLSTGQRVYRRRRGYVYSLNTTLDPKTCVILESARRKCKKGQTQDVIIGGNIKITFLNYNTMKAIYIDEAHEDQDIDISCFKDDEHVKYFSKKPKKQATHQENSMDTDDNIREPIKVNDPWLNIRLGLANNGSGNNNNNNSNKNNYNKNNNDSDSSSSSEEE